MIFLDLCRTDFEYRGPAHFDNRDYIQKASSVLCSFIKHPTRIIGFGDGALNIIEKLDATDADKIVFNHCGSSRILNNMSSKDNLYIECDPMIGASSSDYVGRFSFDLFEKYAEKELLISTINGAERIIFVIALGSSGGFFASLFVNWSMETRLVSKENICTFIQLPFRFEGKRRSEIAKDQCIRIEQLIPNTFVFDANESCPIHEGMALSEAFGTLDKFMASKIRDYITSSQS